MWSKLLLTTTLLAWSLSGSFAAGRPYGFGRPATAGEIAAWDIDVRADGVGLPAGHGSVAEGEKIFAETCSGCHLEGGTKPFAAGLDVLVGGQGSLNTSKPLKTIGSYWPTATTLFDYIRRAMPFTAPQSLSNDQVYALTAYLLNRNGVLPADAVLDAASLAAVQLPNRAGFIDRDDWRTPRKP
jgi:cytochrome c